ncbi:COX15/CtaA family protein [Lihuaxuella thermophila]|uniref:Cytochrome c oxidase assembly protein subunit 15 n=1 Tax=Lihuaxuella thermophila TaxID=1173111 RepID=A0A1H8ELP2_9BACL|nr:heme A synthase [Lihuaxuella thermophila]SEN20415.1 cytochrome c oxidase assembly protein subunit 15 [Lihuaxuella thermophila]
MKNYRLLRILALITSFGSYVMLLMGAIVSKTGSGKGCGNSWPFCHGQLIPESLPIETVIEYSHRIVSGGVGFLILILTVWSWLAYRTNRRVKVLGFMSLFFVVLQGALGALTVVFEGAFAKKFALALHFGFSLISFASVVLLAICLFQLREGTAARVTQTEPKVSISKRLHYAIWGLAAYTYVVVYTGALVRHAQATMGCGYAFPLCGETYFPNLSSLAGIHMFHRYAAISLWLCVLGFLWVVIRRYKEREDLFKGSWIAFILITLQALSGIITVFTGGQLVAALVHTTIISIFFSALSYLCMQVGLPWKREQEESRPSAGKETPVLS